jgi:hypothetical protein
MAKKKRKNKNRTPSSRSTSSQAKESDQVTSNESIVDLNDTTSQQIDEDIKPIDHAQPPLNENNTLDHLAHLKDSIQPIDSDQKNAIPLEESFTTRQKLKTNSYKVQQNIKSKTQRLTSWYTSLPLVKKILWGSIILPMLVILIILNSLILPFLPVIGGIVLTILKFTFVITKFSAFAVYIGYKVAKTCLMIYYCISRTLSGRIASKVRSHQSKLPPTIDASFPQIQVNQDMLDMKMSTKWKKASFTHKTHQIHHHFMFSYLRYAIVGQIILYTSLWKKRAICWKLWRANARDECKAILSVVGQTIFTPYAMGAHKNDKRILIPGDAKILGVYWEKSHVKYIIECPWTSWHFQWKAWPFMRSQSHTAQWELCVETPHITISEINHGFDVTAVHDLDEKLDIDKSK